MRNLALRCKSGESPSAPPIAKIVGDPLIPPLAELPGEGRAIDALAVLVQRHQHGFLRYRRRNRRGFLRDPGRGVARAAFRNFMNRQAAAELAADVLEALAIAFGQFLLGPCFSRPIETTTRRMNAVSAYFPARAFKRAQTTCASADLHRPKVQIAAAAGFCVHNLSRL